MLLASHWWFICHIQYNHSVSRVSMHFSTYSVQWEQSGKSWLHVWDQKILFILLLMKSQTFESYKMLIIMFCIDCTYKISGAWHWWKFQILHFSTPKFSISVFFWSAEAPKPNNRSKLGFFHFEGTFLKKKILESFNFHTYFLQRHDKKNQ